MRGRRSSLTIAFVAPCLQLVLSSLVVKVSAMVSAHHDTEGLGEENRHSRLLRKGRIKDDVELSTKTRGKTDGKGKGKRSKSSSTQDADAGVAVLSLNATHEADAAISGDSVPGDGMPGGSTSRYSPDLCGLVECSNFEVCNTTDASNPECIPCGHRSGPCCDDWNNPCAHDKLICDRDEAPGGICVKCGLAENHCCRGDQCIYGNVCFEGICKRCGKGVKGAPCCSHGNCGSINLFCDYGGEVGDPGTCQPCGGNGQVCCEHSVCTFGYKCVKKPDSPLPRCHYEGYSCGEKGHCPPHTICDLDGSGSSVCKPCGKLKSPCCKDAWCMQGAVCNYTRDGLPMCVPCGIFGERCCHNQEHGILQCSPGLACHEGKDTIPGEPKCMNRIAGLLVNAMAQVQEDENSVIQNSTLQEEPESISDAEEADFLGDSPNSSRKTHTNHG